MEVKPKAASLAQEMDSEKHAGIASSSTGSVGEGDVMRSEEKYGTLHRTLTPRSNVGSGLFIGTGKALANGGPGNMFFGYLIICIGVWANLQNITEMTIAFPTSGNYIDFADRWVDPALAFGAGLAEWLGWTAVFGAEAVFFVILVNFWAEGAVPDAALRAGPDGFPRDGSTWTELPAFKNGFGGFANAMLLAIWAIGDQVFIGVMGGEAASPRFSMAHAANLVPWRVGVFYLVSTVLVSIIVPSDDDRLLGGSGVAASPFVISVYDAGIKGIPDLINACMIIGIIAIALECIFLPSRIIRTMALQRLLPAFIAKVDEKGRPRWALAITSVVALVLTYMSLSTGGNEALNWLIGITSASFFTNWAIIGFTSFRFRAAVRAQKSAVFDQEFGWKSNFWPLAPILVLLISLMLLISVLYLSIAPIGGGGFKAYNFFSYTIGLILIGGSTIAYKLFFRTPWRDPATADLVTGRRVLSTEEIQELQEYYSRPFWRRLGTYLRLW
ncbi:Amino acid/polyamine transporter I [Penicillium sp. DV-2018c]|nr:Amino acid/polyamine transporter I [Penicillium sp. DV-2018c]